MNIHAGAADPDIPMHDILGVRVAALREQEAIALIRRNVAEKRFTKVAFLNAHCSNVSAGDATYRGALADFLVLPDGVGVDFAARYRYGEAFPENLNGTDFVPGLLAGLAEPVTVGLLGAKRSVVDAAAATLRALTPRHRVEVIDDGFFKPQDEPAVLDRLAAVRPDILLVAMGVPRQEIFIAERITARHATVPIAVGALFDFLSGSVPRAPEWMRRARLEWLFRLLIEPGRLWRRYVVGNPLFVARVLAEGRVGR